MVARRQAVGAEQKERPVARRGETGVVGAPFFLTVLMFPALPPGPAGGPEIGASRSARYPVGVASRRRGARVGRYLAQRRDMKRFGYPFGRESFRSSIAADTRPLRVVRPLPCETAIARQLGRIGGHDRHPDVIEPGVGWRRARCRTAEAGRDALERLLPVTCPFVPWPGAFPPGRAAKKRVPSPTRGTDASQVHEQPPSVVAHRAPFSASFLDSFTSSGWRRELPRSLRHSRRVVRGASVAWGTWMNETRPCRCRSCIVVRRSDRARKERPSTSEKFDQHAVIADGLVGVGTSASRPRA